MCGNPYVSHFGNVYGHLEPSPHRVDFSDATERHCGTPPSAWQRLKTGGEAVEIIAVLSHLLENQLPSYSIVVNARFINTY
jgi:hypothetical protein